VRTVDSYLALIPPANADKPKFTATIAATVAPLAALQVALRSLAIVDFDLDTAIGPQLDAIGVRVGRSRELPYPLEGIFFTWDDAARGWDKGIWQGPYSAGYGLYTLDDDTYRRLLRACILANVWDGTVAGAQAVLDAYFTDPDTLVFIQDDGYSALNAFFTWDDDVRGWDQGAWEVAGDTTDATPLPMRMSICIAGKLPGLIDLGLLGQGAFRIRPSGVALDYAVTSIDGAAVFGWDMDNEYVSGWDDGAWGVDPAFIAANEIPSA
jgi:hypothetical protein